MDTRLLIMLAMLASQNPWQVVAFGGASPGVPLTQVLFRQVTSSHPAAGTARRALAASLALVRASALRPTSPPRPAIVRPPGEARWALRIDFAAPSPPGLLTGGASG